MVHFSFTLFGTFQASLNGQPVTKFPTDKIRALLVYLLHHADQPLRRDRLTGLLWAEQPEKSARHNLRQSLYRLKRTLDAIEPQASDQLLTITRQTIQLHSRVVESDAQHMAQLLAKSHTTTPHIQAHTQAIQLYQGEFLSGFSLPDAIAFEEWLLVQREGWAQQVLQTLHLLTQHYQQQNDLEKVTVFAARQIELEPLRESAYRNLMLAAAKQGQRNKALTYYEACSQLLMRELGVEPAAETTVLYEQIKAEVFAEQVVKLPDSQLPVLITPFIGRDGELAEACQRLQSPDCRVLTLLGPGGIGKTSLATAVSHQPALIPLFPDGRFFVPLVGTDSPDFLVAAIGRGIGLTFRGHQPEKEQLWAYCRAKKALLILDNFEHLVAGATLLAELTAVAPHIKLLVTSRESLNIKIEQRMLLTGLVCPSEHTEPGCGAVELFVQAGRRVKPDFMMTAENETAVHKICQLVQGSPLAIEFAAAWLRLMSCDQIVTEIKRNLDFLASSRRDVPERHRSMRAIFEQSWRLLAPSERFALTEFAHFRGGFSLDAALTITQVSITNLANLLDKSLLQRNVNGRYQMHQLLRQFARSQPHAQLAAFRRRYGRYYLRFVAGQENELRGHNPQQAIATIQQDLNNIRQALQWALDIQMRKDLSRSIPGLGRFYHVVGLFREASQYLQKISILLETWPPTKKTMGLRCQTALQNSHFLGQLGAYKRAIDHARMAQHIATQLEEDVWLAKAHSLEGEWQRHLGEYELSKGCLETAVALFSSHNHSDARSYAHTLNEIGFIHLKQSRYDAALTTFKQAHAIYEAADDQTEISTTLGYIGYAYQNKADYPTALAHVEQALLMAQKIGYKQGIVKHFINLGSIHFDQGNLDQAYSKHQQALKIAEDLGYMRGIINAQIQLGMTLYGKGQLDEAEQWYQRAKQRASAANLQDLIALVTGRQAVVYKYLGKTDEAISAYKQAIQLLRPLNNQRELGRVLGSLGNLYLRMEEHDQAKICFDQAYTAVQVTGAKQAIANATANLGNLYQHIGLYKQAIPCFQEALAIFQEIDHKRGTSVNMGWLGVMHAAQGEFEAARWRFGLALQLSKEMGDETSMIVWSASLGDVAKSLGQYEQASAYNQQVIEQCRSRNNVNLLSQVLVQEVEVRFEQKDFEQVRLLLDEALQAGEYTKDQFVLFSCSLYQARLWCATDEVETAVSHLNTMLTHFSQAKYQAEVYFYLWQMTGEEGARETAVSLYQNLLDKTPNYQYRQYLNRLLQTHPAKLSGQPVP